MGVYAFLTTGFWASFGPSRFFALPCQSRLNPDMLQGQVLCERGGCSAVLAVLDVTES